MASKRCEGCGKRYPDTQLRYSDQGEICDACFEATAGNARLLGSYAVTSLVAVVGSLLCWLVDPAWAVSAISGAAALRTVRVAPSWGPKAAVAVATLIVLGHVWWELAR